MHHESVLFLLLPHNKRSKSFVSEMNFQGKGKHAAVPAKPTGPIEKLLSGFFSLYFKAAMWAVAHPANVGREHKGRS